jgi:hypothetical protein
MRVCPPGQPLHRPPRRAVLDLRPVALEGESLAMPDYPGFTFWDPGDTQRPFPIGDIDPRWVTDEGVQAIVEVTLPPELPAPRTAAVRTIGVAHKAQLWFALECTTRPDGTIAFEAVLHGRHLHFWKDHGESAAGDELELRIPDAVLRDDYGFDEVFGDHGPHCDLCDVIWSQAGGKLQLNLRVTHLPWTEREYKQHREEAAHKSQKFSLPVEPWPEAAPPPEPAPEPVPPVDGVDGS